MRSFASGGSALTGTEAISNGVSVFRQPESRNARITMIWMSCILGSLVLGVSALAAVTHPVPYVSGTPTVVYQVAKYVYGSMPLGRVLVFILQASTVFILVLAANTSFTGFPFLASFAADDSLPAAPADPARPPAGLLDGHHCAHRRFGRAAPDHPVPGRQAHPALRHWGLHRLHHGRRRHGSLPPETQRGSLAPPRRHQRHVRRPVAHRGLDHRGHRNSPREHGRS